MEPSNHQMPPPLFTGKLLADLVDMDSTEAVFREALYILSLIHPRSDPTPFTNAFNYVVSLYQGKWPGERACNTSFHDLRHITDTLLAMIRLIHGAVIAGHPVKPRDSFVGLISALAHDSGFIQDELDCSGTGAKYTTVHVQRSMAFIERYGERYGLFPEEIPECQSMIQCTDLDIDVADVQFSSPMVELMAKLLGCADLIGQMADRIYLEKLFYLYREFEEGRVPGYKDEMDLLRQTLKFFPMIQKRLKGQLGGYEHYAKAHFNQRWGRSVNLYQVAIEKQRKHLEHILGHSDSEPSRFLRRKQIVQRILQTGR